MTAAGDIRQFDATPVLNTLHPFQRDAAEYAFQRLFMDADSSRRFLIADEVGLGKTHIAQGIIAKTIEHLRDKVKRIDVVYICSNQAIARQNIRRLNPLTHLNVATAERVTLLPLQLSKLEGQDVNLIAFTPGTSLDVSGSLGTSKERRLLHVLLQDIWGLKGKGSLNVLQGNVVDRKRFRRAERDVRREYGTSSQANRQFATAFAAELAKVVGLKERFMELCDRYGWYRKHIPDQDRKDRNAIVGQLRSTLARTCIAALEPDLIILDEFQRFKDLLAPVDSEEPGNEAAEIAQQLFNWSQGSARAHVLLLSATPYKPYTLQHEELEDNHYEDFLRTVQFLQNGSSDIGNLKEQLGAYRRELLHFAEGSLERLGAVKAGIEGNLRKVMSRTERLAVAGETNGMLRSILAKNLPVSTEDVKAYVALRAVGDAVKAEEPVEYWKAAAYPLDFMGGYQLKDRLQASLLGSDGAEPVADVAVAMRRGGVSAPKADSLERRCAMALPNAKVRHLISDLERMAAFEVLWVPPCLPAYALEGGFAKARASGMTKRLIFSAWNVAPRSIAAWISYEAERRALEADRADSEAMRGGQDPRALLRIEMDGERPAGMPVLALMYPSPALASLCDPHAFVAASPSAVLTLGEARTWAIGRIREALPEGVRLAQMGEQADERWYWAAPLLFDQKLDAGAVASWWGLADLAERWAGADADEEGEAADRVTAAWSKHIRLATDALSQGQWPTGPAPSDLLEVLAVLGLSGPGCCALRAMRDLDPGASEESDVMMRAAQVGRVLVRQFNRPQSIWVVRSQSEDAPYWRQVLEYGARGALDSVVREYAHMLRGDAGTAGSSGGDVLSTVAEGMEAAIGIRAVALKGEQLAFNAATGQPGWQEYRLRSLFAMRYGSDKSEDEQQAVRDSTVRAAFNSPFWPFVLASTSVGQEGLDFHWYCHAVVHWNLPSNPVDLEQREGRVHRFKGHAVRKNVASQWGQSALASSQGDRWRATFQLAEREARPSEKGLVPYWLYPLAEGAFIERHIPLYPMSRDELRYQALMRSLGAYRLAFGQPRQDELLAYLMGQIDAENLKKMVDTLKINLAPPPHTKSETAATEEQR